MESHKIVIELPQEVKNIIDRLSSNGHEAFAVGGCVRDSLCSRTPKDWDITTSALPQEVKVLFKRTIDTGIQHGTVTVMIDKTGYEITTYRIDGDYEDSRHPSSVEFSRNLMDDLKRRDFTINAMAYNDKDGLIDLFGGMKDLENHIIRCVGNARDRFNEDALRMMRAIRFSAQLGFRIEEDTFAAIKELAFRIELVSKERIHDELHKTLISDYPEKIIIMYESGLLTNIFSMADDIFRDDNREFLINLLRVTKPQLVLRYAALFYGCNPRDVKDTLKNLKIDNYTVLTTLKLVQCCKLQIQEDEYAVRKLISEHGKDMAELIIEYRKNIIYAWELISGEKKEEKAHILRVEMLFWEIINRGDCVDVKGLHIRGNDLLECGLKGAEVGRMLNELLEQVLKNQKLNDRQILISMIQNR